MKRLVLLFHLIASVSLFVILMYSQAPSEELRGKELYEIHCPKCHPDGGNRLNPLQTLRRKDLEANGFRTSEDIVRKMRNPEVFSPHMGKWSAMKKFDKKMLSDEDAFKIADYVLNAFK